MVRPVWVDLAFKKGMVRNERVNLSFSSLFAGFVFGVIGLFLFREGKKRSNIKMILVAILMMGYSYFTSTPLMDWGIGIGLCILAYYLWES